MDGIIIASFIVCLVSVVIAVIYSVVAVDNYREYGEDDNDYKSAKRIAKKAWMALIISLLITVFCPSKKEMLAICGIGGTIDYIKSNDKVEELPEKVIDALDKYVDTLTE